jgi:hypothetical protein
MRDMRDITHRWDLDREGVYERRVKEGGKRIVYNLKRD